MKTNLKNIASIQMGQSFRHKLERSHQGNIFAVQIKDITDQELAEQNLVKIKLSKIKPQHLIFPNDILFRSRGNIYSSVLVQPSLKQTIVIAPLFRIRIQHQDVLPEYIQWFLNQPIAKNYFKKYATGTSIQMISKKRLEELEIYIPSYQKQKEIIQLIQLFKQEQKMLQQLKEKKDQRMNFLLMKKAMDHSYQKPFT